MVSLQDAPQLPPEFTTPALVGLLVVLTTCAIIFLINSLKFQKVLGSQGSKYVQDDYGTSVVRRSMRSAKKPERWEPPLIGQGAEKSPLATAEKVANKAAKATKQAAEKVKEEVKQLVPELTPPKARGRPRKSEGARPKSPKASRPTTSPSPTRTRRVKSPRT